MEMRNYHQREKDSGTERGSQSLPSCSSEEAALGSSPYLTKAEAEEFRPAEKKWLQLPKMSFYSADVLKPKARRELPRDSPTGDTIVKLITCYVVIRYGYK